MWIPSVHAIQDRQQLTLVGPATIVVADDFDRRRSERWYFLTDQETGERYRVFFDGPPPQSFQPGAIFEAQLDSVEGGYRATKLERARLQDAPSPRSGPAQPLAVPELRTVLTLLVDFDDASVGGPGVNHGVTIADVRDFMFDDSLTVAGLYEEASLGRLLLQRDTDSNGQADVFGPYEIDALLTDPSSGCPYWEWMDKATAAWQLDNPAADLNGYQHVVFILPNYLDFPNQCWWSGLGSICPDQQCWAISTAPGSLENALVVAHELGHNFWLDHAGTDTDNDGIANSEYNDWSDFMGAPEDWVKLNGPHADYMGWTDPVTYEIRSVEQAPEPQMFELFSMDDTAAEWPGLRGLRLPRDDQSTYYITYRLNTGRYGQVPAWGPGVPDGWADRINIHYVYYQGSAFSRFVTSLAAGETFRDPTNNLRIIAGNAEARFNGSGGSTQAMALELCAFDCGPQTFTIDITPTELLTCIDEGGADLEEFTLDVGSLDGAAESVSLYFASPLPGNLGGTISPSTVISSQEGTTSTVTLDFEGNPMALEGTVRIEGNPDNGYPREVEFSVGVFDQQPGPFGLSTPQNAAQDVDPQPAFTWSASEDAYRYLLEVSGNPEFTDPAIQQWVRQTEFVPSSPLPLGTEFFWRVTPINGCGAAQDVPVRSFVTRAEGICPDDEEPVFLLNENFEGASGDWEHEATIGPDTWTLASGESVSPDKAWQATKVYFASDQRLSSPAISLDPAASNPKLEFFTRFDLDETGLPDYCYDAGILEYSVDQGASWEQVPDERLETYPYHADVVQVFDNPLDPRFSETRPAWCGKGGWERSTVDLDGFQGEQLQFRFRFGTGNWNRPGTWHIDDVSVYHCVPSSLIRIFEDGFESGATEIRR